MLLAARGLLSGREIGPPMGGHPPLEELRTTIPKLSHIFPEGSTMHLCSRPLCDRPVVFSARRRPWDRARRAVGQAARGHTSRQLLRRYTNEAAGAIAFLAALRRETRYDGNTAHRLLRFADCGKGIRAILRCVGTGRIVLRTSRDIDVSGLCRCWAAHLALRPRSLRKGCLDARRHG